MILTCPACGTSYVVKDGAIPPQGRQVRCASCKHSWHQDPEPSAEAAPVATQPFDQGEPAAEPAGSPASVPDPSSDGNAVRTPEPPVVASEPEPVPAAVIQAPASEPPPVVTAAPEPEATAPAPEPAAQDDFADWDRGAYAQEPRPRRSGPFIILGLVLLVAALAAAAWFFAPRAWLARAGLREASGTSPLKLAVSPPGRQKLASGNDLVSLSGRIINPTEQTLNVPPLQADLRDGGGKLVYSWTIAPPAARLAPRASASFNSAELGVPPNAQFLTLRWTD